VRSISLRVWLQCLQERPVPRAPIVSTAIYRCTAAPVDASMAGEARRCQGERVRPLPTSSFQGCDFCGGMRASVQEADLDGQTHASMADLESFAESTSASLLYLALEACGVRDDRADLAARSAPSAPPSRRPPTCFHSRASCHVYMIWRVPLSCALQPHWQGDRLDERAACPATQAWTAPPDSGAPRIA
jgi:hypothetical protein